MTPIERFRKKYTASETGCWLWTASKNASGYGQFMPSVPNPSPMLAHRASWELHNGPVPDGACVLHRCDVRHCVNPAHLFLGTKRDNTQDMLFKGRDSGGQPSKTGIRGVHWNAQSRRWRAFTRHSRGRKLLYNGADFFEACCARKSWESVYK